ncbi:MAG: EAL domain-containing protein [Solirubrobacteraceae bacterium]|nr:EAL domain-containing protein [Solirubrobacteraceae bacterium]
MSPGHTRITLLGNITIQRAGEVAPAVGLSGRRSEIVFAYLACEHRRSVSRDELANALWPELLPDTWNAALRGVLSDVRRFLERAGLDPAETLRTEQGRVRLHLPEGATVDVDETKTALSAARTYLAVGDPSAAAGAAGRAADATALSFLPSHDEGWASEVRSELDSLHTEALEVQAQALAQAGDARAALAAADRLVRAEPFHEGAHRLRITLLGEAGDRAGALKAYERCKALLAAELGITPSPETAAALRQAMQGSPAGGAAPAQHSAAAPPPGGAATRFDAYSVLVVEDHDFQRRTTLTLLRSLGVADLHDASDGTAALALLDGTPAPDVIICDIDMPGMDGVEFIRNVAERRLASAVVIASGLDGRVLETVRAASEGYGLQVLGAVGKPLTAAALEGMLGAYRPQRKVTTASAELSGSMATLAAALDDGTLAVDFEPIIDLATGRVAGLRPTVRWPFADDLLVAADDAGLGRRLVEHVLREARAATRRLDLDAFVELTPNLLTDVSLADGLAAITRERVVLVAGAGALASHDSPAMLDVLARLRVKGYGLCLDGFDLGALERLPLTHIQLPADLVIAAASTGDSTQLGPAVDGSRLLGVPLIGRCETEAEFELLLAVGCSFAHGPFLAPAAPGAQLERAVEEWTAPPVTIDGSR